MTPSRLTRYEERKQRQRLVLAITGSITVILFLLFFGVKILVGFSLFVDRIRGAGSQSQTTQVLIQPPVLDPLTIATNSSTLILTGRGQPELTLVLYHNEAEAKKLTLSAEGSFSVTSVELQEGTNTLSAKLIDDKGNVSDLSNVVTTSFKKTPPSLEISSPPDNSTSSGENKTVVVSGKTSEDTTITVNDRLVVVKSDGSFSYNYPLTEGDNILRIVATDTAGNQTIIERKVTYQK